MADELKIQEETLVNGGSKLSDGSTISGDNIPVVDIEYEKDNKLTYKISSNPPIYLTFLLAVQHCFVAVPWGLTLVLIICKLVCAMDEDEFMAELLSTTIFISGVCTILQVTFGVRLPVFQGATSPYVVPLLAIAELPDWQCPVRKHIYDGPTGYFSLNRTDIMGNTSFLDTHNTSSLPGVFADTYRDTVVIPRIQLLKGSLILAGGIHMLIGMTGCLGIILKFIGPITVIPTILLVGLNVFKVTANFCGVYWGTSIPTAIIGLILSLYLGEWKMPIKIWKRKVGFKTTRFPLHQVLALFIALVIGWILSLIFTAIDIIPNDKSSKNYYGRTDSRLDVITQMPWFYLPHPWQFGSIDFSVGIFAAYLVATFVSIIDSVADYYAVARSARVPPPPQHSVNRGIMIEGFMSFFAGFFGTGHGTTTYGDNIGIVGVTKVASRSVFQCLGALMILMAIVGKVAAVFINIPVPILGGVSLLGFGAFIGILFSNFQFIDIKSFRNLTIIGLAVLLGLVVSYWVTENSDAISVGNKEVDTLLQMLLTNSNLIGGVIACFLDNTVPGSLEDRGMLAWDTTKMEAEDLKSEYEEGLEVYEIGEVTKFLKRFWWTSYIPFSPTFQPRRKQEEPLTPESTESVDRDTP